MNLKTTISALTRVGKTAAKRLKNLGLETVEDLIFYFPFRYEDFSLIKKIRDLTPNEPVTIRGKIQLIANRRSFRKRKILTEALVGDETGSVKVIWFNQPYLTKTLQVGDWVYLSGQLDETRFQFISPEYERVRDGALAIHTARLVPIYHLTEGVTQKQLRFLLKQTLPLINQIAEYLPADIVARNKFAPLKDALLAVHFPENQAALGDARRRLKFDELFLIQLAIQQVRKQIGENKAGKISFLEKATKDFVNALPFKLTNAQKKCAWEILRDLEKERPMNRLLEGDVGSGKTVVVAIAMLNAILNGYKVAMMAPTEILANQHFATLCRLFEKQKFRIALLTAGKRQISWQTSLPASSLPTASKRVGLVRKGSILDNLRQGECDIVVGTHALIEEGVEIKDLGLVVVDEQHRFGVEQRKTLLLKEKQNGVVPHFLSMTSTPIPRTLVLTLYGDLDLSIINEMPPGRKPIVTRVVYEQDRLKAYEFIKKQVGDGRQIFVICQLIDPSDKLGVRSVKQEFEKLDKEIFPDLKIGLMHGRLKSKEKEAVMRDFSAGLTKILVSTSVIEVGIDIANATIMMIEGADRFGLAQLHQFRGRVGRGAHQSYCFLFSDSAAPLTQKRLRYLETCVDGFKLAEKDLELRGPGEIYGLRQAGLPDLKIASLTDSQIIKIAQEEARRVVEFGALGEKLTLRLGKMKLSMHFE